jgi:hypothetical protein
VLLIFEIKCQKSILLAAFQIVIGKLKPKSLAEIFYTLPDFVGSKFVLEIRRELRFSSIDHLIL